MIRTSTIHNLKKIHKYVSNHVLKKILDEIRILKKSHDVAIDIFKYTSFEREVMFFNQKLYKIIM
ncbi:hypothetical protein [uncultured Methanobrevibacter sp.]|uniref:hypothetical protein n=1 Tax=uncultured Methanobrevibacter sp. TaxID=253161 RepID=UPI0025E12511|nr:hypothetical protein [uncultured Methanobrevibacter sp.]